MQAVEPYLVSIIIQLANMPIPISTSQDLQLANSLINGTRFKDELQWFEKWTYDTPQASWVVAIGGNF